VRAAISTVRLSGYPLSLLAPFISLCLSQLSFLNRRGHQRSLCSIAIDYLGYCMKFIKIYTRYQDIDVFRTIEPYENVSLQFAIQHKV
jgi:hypothetical protein